MARFEWHVLAKAIEGQEDELARWYDQQHIPDLLRVPGIKAANRRDLRYVKRPEGSPLWTCLTVYELDAEDPMDVLKECGKRMGTPDMPRTDALDSSGTLSYLVLPAA